MQVPLAAWRSIKPRVLKMRKSSLSLGTKILYNQWTEDVILRLTRDIAFHCSHFPKRGVSLSYMNSFEQKLSFCEWNYTNFISQTSSDVSDSSPIMEWLFSISELNPGILYDYLCKLFAHRSMFHSAGISWIGRTHFQVLDQCDTRWGIWAHKRCRNRLPGRRILQDCKFQLRQWTVENT